MMRCDNCDNLYRENAGLADELAFWAYQAKALYARAQYGVDYDRLTRAQEKEVDKVFDNCRAAENRERTAHAEPPRDIGGTYFTQARRPPVGR